MEYISLRTLLSLGGARVSGALTLPLEVSNSLIRWRFCGFDVTGVSVPPLRFTSSPQGWSGLQRLSPHRVKRSLNPKPRKADYSSLYVLREIYQAASSFREMSARKSAILMQGGIASECPHAATKQNHACFKPKAVTARDSFPHSKSWRSFEYSWRAPIRNFTRFVPMNRGSRPLGRLTFGRSDVSCFSDALDGLTFKRHECRAPFERFMKGPILARTVARNLVTAGSFRFSIRL